MNNHLPLFLPCAAGVESYLDEEVRTILAPAASIASNSPSPSTARVGHLETEVVRGGVRVRGSWHDVLMLNLECRLAQRVLIQLSYTPYSKEQDLYDAAYQVQWEQWMGSQRTMKVEVTAQRSPLKSLHFAALKIKDAVVDRLRQKTGARPSIDTHFPDVRIYAHLSSEHLSVYLDTSGEPLFKRGWREDKGDAPLKETLAAAMLFASGWVQSVRQGQALPLYDPCCGSGTLLIEAAQILCEMPAGGLRRFGFEKLLCHQALLWKQCKEDASSRSEAALARLEGEPVRIFGSDIAFRMVDFARRNALRAGVEHALDVRGGDALERMPPSAPGILLLNPPYGERIEAAGKAGQTRSVRQQAQVGTSSAAPDVFFERLASHWKRHYAGWTAWMLTPDTKIGAKMRLRESRRIPMWNGPIECRLMRFDMSAGRHGDARTKTDLSTTASPNL